MKLSGTFRIVGTNLVTGEQREIQEGNVITNRFYRDVLRDGSSTSIGFYLWTSPVPMVKSRRRLTVEASAEFLNDAYGYMPSSDWFARYVLAEPSMPGYFETRSRLDPPATGVRVIRSIIMSSTSPRTDSVTGLLPEYSPNTVIDVRTLTPGAMMSKLPIFAFVTLEDDCIQSTIEVFDIYYRLVFDNNYADVNLSQTAIEMLGKQSTAKMPTVNVSGSTIVSTPMTIPALSSQGPVNFITPTVLPSGISPTNGDFWHDYGNVVPTSITTNGYVSTYTALLEKDSHVGKLLGTLYCSGFYSGSFLSGYKNIHADGDTTIGNTHSHSDLATTPFFDPSRLARGTGYCDLSSNVAPDFPEYIEVNITQSGSVTNAQYKIKKYPFTGFYKNTYEVLPIEVPHIGQMVINTGSWRGGTYYNGTDNMHGFLTGKAGTHPSPAGITYDAGANPYTVIGRIGISEYSGIREYSENELIGYDKEGVSILSLSGSVRSINRFKFPSFAATNIIQVEVDKTTGDIYAACKTTGLYKVNSSMTTSVKVMPAGVVSGEKCYGFDMYNDKMMAWFDSAIYYSVDHGDTWTVYQHEDYAANGLDKTKIVGIRADLTSITPNILILFSNVDGLYTTSKTAILSAWWAPTIFNVLNISPSMNPYGVSPSFNGIDYVEFVNGTFYLTFNGASTIYGQVDTYIGAILFDTSTLNEVFAYVNGGVDGFPLFLKYNNKDYIICTSGGTIYRYNITDSVLENTISNYGHNIGYINLLNMDIQPYYATPLSNGLILYRGAAEFSLNIYNSNYNPNIRNNIVNESSQILVTKIVNPFFNTTARAMFEKEYGWDGNQFSTVSTYPKVIGDGVDAINGVNLTFTGLALSSDFISGDKFTAIRAKGFVKDNASLAKVFLSNSHFIKSPKYVQAGNISAVSTFHTLDRFEVEEATIDYNTSHFIIHSRNTPFDYMHTSKIPQEAGTMKITVDALLKGGYAAIFNLGEPAAYQSGSFGIMVYKVGSAYKARVTTAGPSYMKQEMVVANPGYAEISVSVGDTLEISYTTSSTRRVFTLKHNGTILYSGLNFDGQLDSTNEAKLSIYYVPLSIEYPCPEENMLVKKPEFRYDETATVIPIPLTQFHSDDRALTINGENYGYTGDVIVKIAGFLAENNGITGAAREIATGHCAIDNLSGTVYFSKNDQAKPYSIEFVYYKDTA